MLRDNLVNWKLETAQINSKPIKTETTQLYTCDMVAWGIDCTIHDVFDDSLVPSKL